ncbi:MAG: EF-hand domain-containing protein [Verrucomicrobiales bacterium]|nr:EF-hand domain-containing protein [Verrucomicrobiales bacterium]
MKKTTPTALVTAMCALLLNTNVLAQDRGPGGPPGFRPDGGRGERGERGFPRRDPFMATFDINNDGVIDAKEIAEAAAALKKLDKNGDGQLTAEELRPNLPERGGPGGFQANPEEMANRLLQFDKDGDGRISATELPERMQALMARADANKDGFLTREELLLLQLPPTREGVAPQRGGDGGPGPRPERRLERQ